MFEARSVDRVNDQRASYGAEGKRSLVQQIILRLDSNRLHCEKKTGPIRLVLVDLTVNLIISQWLLTIVSHRCSYIVHEAYPLCIHP